MRLITIYSVPFWQTEYPRFEKNKDLFLDIVKKYKEVTPSISTKSSYESPHTFQSVTEMSDLYDFICQMCLKATTDLDFIECDIALTSVWFNINDSRQNMNNQHVHRDVFSGVFYLKCPEGSGNLVLHNPTSNSMWSGCDLAAQKNEYTGESIRIDPVEGNIILFPSYLPHSVETNDHDDERISISFNLIALPKGSIEYKK